MFRYLITGLLLLVLAGCMLGPDFVSPSASTDANETFRMPDQHQPSADAVSLAEREWRQVYQDEQLQLLIEQGLSGNFDLQTARIRLEQAGHKMAEGLYSSAGQEAGEAPSPGDAPQPDAPETGGDDVIDAEFEVKE